MKKHLIRSAAIVVVAVALCMGSYDAFAAQTDTVAVRVTVTPVLSVNITETSLALGSVASGSTTVSTSGITVTNDGSGVNETYSLSVANPAAWTVSQTAPGTEIYVLNAAFSNLVSGVTWNEANHALSTTAVASSSTKFAGDQTGVSVPKNATRKLWFQFKAPTATAATTEQTITLTVTAQVG